MASDKLIIAGPCSAESRVQLLRSCTLLAENPSVGMLRIGVWKPRTKPGGFEGVGAQALEWVKEAKELTGLPVAIEVARAEHVEAALKYGVDMLWIGARSTVNPFAVQEIAEALRGVSSQRVFIKNPLSADVGLWAGALERLQGVGLYDLGLIHRGFTSYNSSRYRNSPMWHLALDMQRLFPTLPMICDPSHIAGKRELIAEISQMAADLNFDGLMVESHCDPSSALSDAEQQLTPQDFSQMLSNVVWRNATLESESYTTELSALRSRIDTLDGELFDILSRRMQISREIGELKSQNNVVIVQNQRWSTIVKNFLLRSEKLGLSQDFVQSVLGAIHSESIENQNKIYKK